jgi:hypothetical protein
MSNRLEEDSFMTKIMQIPNEVIEEKAANFLRRYVNGADYLEEVESKFSYSSNLEEIDTENFFALEKLVNENPNGVSLFEIFSDNTLLMISHPDTDDIILDNISNSNLPEELKKADEVAKIWLLEFIEYARQIFIQQGKNLPRKYSVQNFEKRKYFFPE